MQFDVFANPLARTRGAYPYVVVLQADIAAAGRERLVALMPVVTLGTRPFVVLMPSITKVPVSALGESVGDLRVYRESLLEAIEAMFMGG